MGDGLINQTLRALRLDTTLCREVAAPGASTRHAAAVVALAALGTGAALGAVSTLPLAWGTGRHTTFEGDLLRFVFYAVFVAIVHLLAWPLWASLIRLAGKWPATSDSEARDLGQTARAIAFAQAPGALGVLVPLLLMLQWVLPADPEPLRIGSRTANVMLLAGTVRTLLSAWVLVGTFLVVRQILGLSTGRTLGTIFAAGIGTTVLLGMATVAIILVSKIVVTVFDLYLDLPDRDVWAGPWLFAYGFGIPAAQGFEFNLGLGLSSLMMEFVAPLAPAIIP